MGTHAMPGLVVLPSDHPEVVAGFRQLGCTDAFEDCPMLDAESGEDWQYMGTVTRPSGRVEHEYRHRCHPITKRREYAAIPAGAVQS